METDQVISVSIMTRLHSTH